MTGHARELCVNTAGRFGGSAAKNKKARRGQAEKKKIYRDDVTQNLVITAGERYQDSRKALHRNGDHRHATARVEPGDRTKEKPIFGHGEIDPRRRENGL